MQKNGVAVVINNGFERRIVGRADLVVDEDGPGCVVKMKIEDAWVAALLSLNVQALTLGFEYRVPETAEVPESRSE